MLALLVAMRKLCANKWRQSVRRKNRPPSSKPKSRSVLSRKRAAERRRSRRSADKKRSVSASLRKKLSARLKRRPRLSRCAPCSSNRCRWRSNSATSNSFAMAMSRTNSRCTLMMTMIGCQTEIGSKTTARASSSRRPKL